MKTRLITSAVGIAILFAVTAFFHTVFFDLVIALIAIIAIHEIFNAFKLEKAAYIFWSFVPYTLLLMLFNFEWARILLLPASYIFVVYLSICVIKNSQDIQFAKLSGMTMLSGIVIFCFFSFIYLKRLLPQEKYGYDAIYFMFLILGFSWGGDSAAYFAGRFFGKHKLAPIVSPKKTIEGAVGGVCGSMVMGIIITFIYSLICNKIFGFPLESLGIKYYILITILGAIASVLGILGDLLASAVKRQCGIKDYGTIFPGHGGVMDRFDSVMFVAPFVSIAVTLVFYYFAR
ncbi:MAG: phosphatidate cytidylyltransferase [Oscillospiraceae bacterium]